MERKKINLTEIREAANVGVRRAALFLGFSINCAEDTHNASFLLESHTAYRFLPNELTPDQVAEVKSEFAKWAIANSFRELVESFEVYLDRIFDVVCHLSAPSVTRKSFLNKGISDKLSLLKNDFGIETELAESFDTINRARNCLYHRQGFVDIKDTNQGDRLMVKWLAIETRIGNPDGDSVVISFPTTDEVAVEPGESLFAVIAEKSKSFAIGESVAFSVNELSELCLHFMIQLDKIGLSILAFLEKNGASLVAS